MTSPFRQVAAITVAIALLALISMDLMFRDLRVWWDVHSFTSDVVSNLLVVAITVLIIDDIVARRRRRDRAFSVAIQVLIIYQQAVRTYEAAITQGEESSGSSDPSRELRNLAALLLPSSANLFEDPAARQFLVEVERFTGSVFRSVAPKRGREDRRDARELLTSSMSDLQATADPLIERLPSYVRDTVNRSAQSEDKG
jgi:hypothetical protein